MSPAWRGNAEPSFSHSAASLGVYRDHDLGGPLRVAGHGQRRRKLPQFKAMADQGREIDRSAEHHVDDGGELLGVAHGTDHAQFLHHQIHRIELNRRLVHPDHDNSGVGFGQCNSLFQYRANTGGFDVYVGAHHG